MIRKGTLIMLILTLTGLVSCSGSPEEEAIFKENPVVVLETNRGNITLELFPDIAPKATENFIGLAKKGYYNGVIFHRVIEGFMIQGGDPTGTGSGGESLWNTAFEDEISQDMQFDSSGLLAMANAGPNTNKSQFFITVAATPWLNGKHTIFGQVIKGYSVVKDIEQTPVDSKNRPHSDQKILKVYLQEDMADESR